MPYIVETFRVPAKLHKNIRACGQHGEIIISRVFHHLVKQPAGNALALKLRPHARMISVKNPIVHFKIELGNQSALFFDIKRPSLSLSFN